MKKIEAIITPWKLDAVKDALMTAGVRNMTLSEVKDFGSHPGYIEQYRGIAYEAEVLPELKLEFVVDDQEANTVADLIYATLRTGPLGDGEITILPLEGRVRSRSGKRCGRS
jgi:nitrogen regulatory protein P-II 1